MSVTTRFAPSPTGYLHLGHAHAALFAARRAVGGRFLLRLEDIDPGRCSVEFADAILEDLAWLGVAWDGSVRRQSDHLGAYRGVLDRLVGRGLLYPCFCTRAEIARASLHAPHGPDGPVYPGTCRGLGTEAVDRRMAAGEGYALRLDMRRAVALVGRLSFFEMGEGEVACAPERFGDVILARKDAPASYHLCVTHDDAVQEVSMVTRGVDLRPATDVQRLLQALMGWPVPEYAHHSLLLGADGRRLAKRDGAATLRDLRARGISAAAVRAMAGFAD